MTARSTLLLLLALGGCGASNEMRNNARAIVAQMRLSVPQHEDAMKASMAGVCRTVFDQVNLRLQSEARATASQLRVQVYQAVAAKRAEIRLAIESRLEEALDPLLARLKGELDAERQKNAADATLSRDRELTLATQLATTLAIAQQEAGALAAEASKRLDDVQASLLKSIDEEAAARQPRFDAAEQANKLLESWEGETKTESTYLKAMSDGFDELKRFVDEQSALTLTLQGLVGDKLGSRLGSLLADRANQLIGDTSGRLKEWLDERGAKIQTDVTAKAQEALEASKRKS